MSTFTVEKYVPTINSILRISDLSTISAKRIRHALAQEFPNDEIAKNKSTLDKQIQECFSTISQERENESSEDERPVRQPKELLQSDLLHPSSPPQKRKMHSSPPVRVVKKPRAASPARPKKVKVEKAPDSDEDARFAAELDQALNSGSVRKTRGAGTTRAKPRGKKQKQKNEEEGEKKKRAPNPNNAFHAPMLLSPQLTDVVFETELSRPMVVKKIWEYIKGHDLQNPQQRQEILCDDKLRAIFNVDKIHMFTMNKILSQHMWSKADVVGGNGAVAPVPTSRSSASNSSANRNGKKHTLSDAIVKSDSEDNDSEEPEITDHHSEESRFSDSEDDV